MKKFTWFCVLLALGAGGYFGYAQWKSKDKSDVQFRSAAIARGDIIQSVTANGGLTPVRSVQVGSQISGTITDIKVDFNSRVKGGDIIAQIDPATYERSLVQAEAELSNSTASLELSQLNFKRAKELFNNKLISESEYNTAEVNLHQSEAGVRMRNANVERAKVDLDRTTIYAPIDGVVISRNIEVGQTVASSFNTPTLFLIANDLAKMRIEAAVSEADVGGVTEGQEVTFTVEAYPMRQFAGTVKQVRFAPTTNQNVVTYTCVVEVDNADLKLRPGMTATASIITAQKKGVLKISNAALRFRPPEGSMPPKPTNAAPAAIAKAGAGGAAGTNTASATQLATSGPFAGLPVSPWQAEGRRPNPGERETWEASLTEEQRAKYAQIRNAMRARMGEGGGGGGGGGREGGGRNSMMGGGGGGFGGGEMRPAAQDGPRTQTVYVIEKTKDGSGMEKTTLKLVVVKTGIGDGSSAEVLEGLKEGDVVATGLVTPGSSAPTATAARPGQGGSPFGGSPFGGRGFR